MTTVTVGIPTHNEQDSISVTLESVINQVDVKIVQIIVVASGCTDNTVEIVSSFSKKDKRIKLIVEKERKGKISALNHILKESKGDILFHTDGDVILDLEAIKKAVYYFDKYPQVSGVSGRPSVIKSTPSLFFRWAKNTEKILIKKKIREFRKGDFFHMCGYALAHRKNLIESLPPVKGATDATMGEIIKRSGIIVYDPTIIGEVLFPRNIKDFINQKSRIRFGFLNLNRKQDSSRKLLSELIYIKTYIRNVSFWNVFLLPFMLLIYLASWIKAYYLIYKDAKLEEVWVPIVSTKNFVNK